MSSAMGSTPLWSDAILPPSCTNTRSIRMSADNHISREDRSAKENQNTCTLVSFSPNSLLTFIPGMLLLQKLVRGTHQDEK